MNITFVPLLHLARELYAAPPGPERFRQYLEALMGDGNDVALPPLVAMNPMARGHVAARVEELLALGAEEAAAEATREAARRLAGVAGEFRVGLAVLDDVRGGWTNRPLLEAAPWRTQDVAARASWNGPRWTTLRSWASVGLWASEAYDRADVRREALAAVYRAVHLWRFGPPRTLGDVMRLEGRAPRFAGLTRPTLGAEELAYSREVIAPLEGSTHFPTIFTLMFGDEAARSVGYPPLGLGARAGFAVAREDAWREELPPEEHLVGAPSTG